MESWVANNTEGVGMIVGIVGLCVAVIGLGITAYTVRLARTSQRRDAFMRLHETLLQPEIQEGRRLLYLASDTGDLPSRGSLEYQQINRSLAFYDTLGHYIRHRQVERRQALEIWHHSLRDIKQPVEDFIQAQSLMHGPSWIPWPHLRWLLGEATQYRSSDGCCGELLKPLPVTPQATGT